MAFGSPLSWRTRRTQAGTRTSVNRIRRMVAFVDSCLCLEGWVRALTSALMSALMSVLHGCFAWVPCMGALHGTTSFGHATGGPRLLCVFKIAGYSKRLRKPLAQSLQTQRRHHCRTIHPPASVVSLKGASLAKQHVRRATQRIAKSEMVPSPPRHERRT